MARAEKGVVAKAFAGGYDVAAITDGAARQQPSVSGNREPVIQR
jgi:hypothetical protein